VTTFHLPDVFLLSFPFSFWLLIETLFLFSKKPTHVAHPLSSLSLAVVLLGFFSFFKELVKLGCSSHAKHAVQTMGAAASD